MITRNQNGTFSYRLQHQKGEQVVDGFKTEMDARNAYAADFLRFNGVEIEVESIPMKVAVVSTFKNAS